jgi:hypothetical protein
MMVYCVGVWAAGAGVRVVVRGSAAPPRRAHQQRRSHDGTSSQLESSGGQARSEMRHDPVALKALCSLGIVCVVRPDVT